jgi:nitroimidazol reductase NimA-like FMN-containing flavoprotein (pyridoxamine 5'-phosphate oxidase superfamily)
MRRKDKEVTSREWMLEVLREGLYAEVALCGPEGPYVVPVNYGFDGRRFIFHGAPEGLKFNLVRADQRVCFNVVAGAELIRDEKDPSEYSMKYRSVTGRGRARFVEDLGEKKAALQAIMKHYSGPLEPMPDELLRRTAVVTVDIEELTGKVSSYPKP